MKSSAEKFPAICMGCGKKLDSGAVLDAVKTGVEFVCPCGRNVVPESPKATAC